MSTRSCHKTKGVEVTTKPPKTKVRPLLKPLFRADVGFKLTTEQYKSLKVEK